MVIFKCCFFGEHIALSVRRVGSTRFNYNVDKKKKYQMNLENVNYLSRNIRQ